MKTAIERGLCITSCQLAFDDDDDAHDDNNDDGQDDGNDKNALPYIMPVLI